MNKSKLWKTDNSSNSVIVFMVDVHPPEIRKKNMQAVKSGNTSPEITFRKALHHKGYRYRIAPRELPGKPDIYLPKYKAIIFINGCFWHAHNCHLFKLPQTRRKFWRNKLNGNVERDSRNICDLMKMNYKVLVVWECAIKGKNKLTEELLMLLTITWLNSNSYSGYIDTCGLTYFKLENPEFNGAIGCRL